jgi:ATP-binding cassette subfamily F protein uup
VSFKEKFEFEQMEKLIAIAEAKLEELEAAASQGATKGTAKEQSDAYAKLALHQAEIDSMYARWAELESRIKGSV